MIDILCKNHNKNMVKKMNNLGPDFKCENSMYKKFNSLVEIVLKSVS